MIKLKARVIALSLGLAGAPLWAQTLETLYSFPAIPPADDAAGRHPVAALVIGPDGNLYGTATEGGANGDGTAFRVSPATNEVTILDSFEVDTTGSDPVGAMINIGDGFLYGVTRVNGNDVGDPYGTVYRLDPATGLLSVVFQLEGLPPIPANPVSLASGEPNVLHVLGVETGGLWRIPLDTGIGSIVRNFDTSDGRVGEGSFHRGLMRASDGYLYGVSTAGGVNNEGIVFRISPDGTEFTKLHDAAYATGRNPVGPLTEVNGNFYGLMEDGGSGNHNGVIYRITPEGDYTAIHDFDDFRYPKGGLLLASDGMLYGVAESTGPGGNGNGGIFRIKPDGSGYKVVYVFKDRLTQPFYPQGRIPLGGLVQAADGHLYGTTSAGGANDEGTIFRLKLNLPPPPVNQPPIAVGDTAVTSGEPVLVEVKANDFDFEDRSGTSLTVTVTEAPQHGTAVVQAGGSVLYTPAAGTFTGDAFTYKLTDAKGASSFAEVKILATAAGPLVVPGAYTGLVGSDSDASGGGEVFRGQFVVSVKETGAFTGTLITGKKRAPFRGMFDENGTAFAALNIPGQGKGGIFLHFEYGQPNTLNAAVLGKQFWTGAAGPNKPSDSSKKQAYTVQSATFTIRALAPAGDMPKGYGYGVMTVKPTGAVTMVGKLGDGTNVKWSTNLVSFAGETAIPVFAEPTPGGSYGGFMTPEEEIDLAPAAATTGRFEGVLRWVRAEQKNTTKPYGLGFSGFAYMVFSPYTPPAKGTPVLSINGGELRVQPPDAGPLTGDFQVGVKRITVESPLRSLTINAKTGLFSGVMVDGKRSLPFKGVIDQLRNFGVGQVLVKGTAGGVELGVPRPE